MLKKPVGMLKNAFFVITCCYYICGLYFQLTRASSPSRLPIGAHPLDEKYYDADMINCKDRSKYFKRDRLNDNFCDCPDGTDEPGTSACPGGKFYCRNVGSTPKFLFSSRVNDHICDCCDGSDEYDGSTICPNTCVMGGIVTYDRNKYDSAEVADMDTTIHLHSTKQGNMVDSSTSRFTCLILFAFLQVVFVIFIVGTRLYRRRQSRRRNSRLMFL